VHVSPVKGLSMMWVDQPQFTGFSALVKRTLDIVGALLVLVLVLPLLLVAAAAVRLADGGPILFRQERLGKDGRPFRMLKFRTMTVDAEARRGEVLHLNEAADPRGLYFKIRQDPRVTRAGRWLRRSSLDELPQLVNVLQGHMSLVGPRPLPGSIGDCNADFLRRLRVKPGLTGLWQVSGRSELQAEDAVRLDLYYVENWTLGLDLAIIARTVRAVLRSRGAY
jgi:exopolysaccharide biosynthesis polyprenyl glycosylphosphotransferase